MRRLVRKEVRLTVVAVLALGVALGFTGAASAQFPVFRGITLQKGCVDPTSVGAPLECAFQITNADDTDNSETFSSLEDIVFASGGNVPTSGLLPTLRLIFTPNSPSNPSTPFCVGGSGAGTLLSPYVGATSCTLPNRGSRITTLGFTHYTVVAADYNVNPATHRLNDTGTLGWKNNCEDTNSCSTINQSTTTSASTLIAPAPAIDIEKATNGEDADAPTGPFILVGGAVNWTYLVTNTGDVPLSNVTVGDSVIGPITCPQTTLAVGASMTCTATGTAVAGQYVNNSTATGHFFDLTVTDQDPSHYFGAAPDLALVKRTNGTDDVCPTIPVGGNVTWTYEVTNTGNVTLTNIVVVDDNGTSGNTADDVTVGTIATLAPGATTTLTRTGTAAAGTYNNVATASSIYTATSGATFPVSDTEADCYFGASPAINIVKLTNGTDNDSPTGPIVAVGSTVTWTYVVTNTGNFALTNIVVTDDNGTPGNAADDFTVGTIAGPLAPGATATLTHAGIAQAGQYGNVGTASGTGAGQTVTDTNPDHYFGAAPALSLVKRTNGTDDSCPAILVGGNVTWTYEVTNTGNVSLENIVVVDDHGTPGNTADDIAVGTIAGPLAPGATATLSRGPVPATAGTYHNTAIASTSYAASGITIPVSATEDDCYFGSNPQIRIVKFTNGEDADSPTGPFILVGNAVNWTYVVTNPGNVPLSNVTVTDNNGTPGNTADDFPVTSFTGDTNNDGKLDPTETWHFAASGTAVAGQYANIGRTAGTDALTGTTVTDTNPSHYFGADPHIDIEKATNGDDADSPTGPFIVVGQPVHWTYVVTNTGNVTLSTVTVTDDKGVAVSCPKTVLLPGESMTCTANGTATAGQYANIGSTSGTHTPTGTTVTDTDPSHYFGAAPALSLVKKTNGTDNQCPTGPIVGTGSTVTWTYEVKNDGNVPLTNIAVTDDNGTPGNTGDDVAVGTITGPLAPGATATLTRTGTALAGQYTNVATAAGSYTASGFTVNLSDTDNDCFFGSSTAIDIEKLTNGDDADSPTGPIIIVGGAVNWTYVVTNTSNVTLSNVTVTDNQGVTVTCPKTVLTAGESMTCTASGTATIGQYANIGSVSGTHLPTNTTVSDTDPSHYFGAAPNLALVKKTNATDNQCPTGPTVGTGSTVTWTYEVTNTGNVTLTSIAVTDDNGTPGNTADDVAVGTIATLASGASTTLTRTGTAAAGQYTNIATASSTYTATGGATLTVSDTDNDCYFGATTTIDIEKATNGQDADTAPGPTIAVGAAVNWTYVVTNTSNVTLSNVTVTDDQGVAVSCPKTVLTPGESMTCTGNGTATAGQYANIGTATGTGAGQTVQDTDPSHYFGESPTPNLPCPAGLFLAGPSASATGDLLIAYDQFPAPNDNTYGANSIGWGNKGTRDFKHLLNSDHAGFLLLRPNGSTALSFDIDYATKTTVSASAPSGYASLGPFGGDGVVRMGTLTAADIEYDSSLARNFNRTGYFAGGVQGAATKPPVVNGVDLLVNSPPAWPNINNTTGQYVLKAPNPWTATYTNEEYNAGGVDTTGHPSNFFVKDVKGWNFHNTYFVRLKSAKLTSLGFGTGNANTAPTPGTRGTNYTFSQFAERGTKCPGKWCVVPNDEQLHNSPAKLCPVPGSAGPPVMTATNKAASQKTVTLTITNQGGANQELKGLKLTWPAGNGQLQSVALGGVTVYNTPTSSPLDTSSLLGTAAQRTIASGASATLTYTFANNAIATLGSYSGNATFDPHGTLTLLP